MTEGAERCPTCESDDRLILLGECADRAMRYGEGKRVQLRLVDPFHAVEQGKEPCRSCGESDHATEGCPYVGYGPVEQGKAQETDDWRIEAFERVRKVAHDWRNSSELVGIAFRNELLAAAGPGARSQSPSKEGG